jgi:amidohydrolase
MASKEAATQRAFAAIDRRADELIALSKAVLNDAEPGYREHRTAAKIDKWMLRAGLSPRTGIAITGVVVKVDTGRPGPAIAVIGELDSLIVPGHANAHPETGAAHACGHHAQLGSMLGVLTAILDDSVRASLSGSVTFMAVPAEEYIELDFRESLRAEGKIEFFGGKQEFIRLGEFDDIDMAMLTHTTAEGQPGVIISGSHNGMVGKTAEFRGVAAHAGAAPHLGINALNAANIALSAIHAQRETFRDADYVRVHPIITHGGDSVSSVPSRVSMDTYIRAANIDAIIDGSRKVDRALRAGAMAVGGEVSIRTTPGYMPSRYDPVLADIYRRNAEPIFGKENVRTSGQRASSSDAGDVSLLMPTIHPWVECATGNGHGIDYLVQDYDMAVVKAAKAMAATVIDLLGNDADTAHRILRNYRPEMTKERYLAQLRELRSEKAYTG